MSLELKMSETGRLETQTYNFASSGIWIVLLLPEIREQPQNGAK